MLPYLGHAVLAMVSVAAQDNDPAIPPVSIPRLPPAAGDAKGFVPAGWKLQVQAAGDLNGDGRPDLVFVLHDADPKLVLHNKGLGVNELDTNPRILAVAFARPQGGYALVAQNSKLIPRWTEATLSDNFAEEGSLTVARGAFTVGLYHFANAGGWDTGTISFTFRWQNGRFELIGAEDDDLQRNTGGTTVVSVNYSTGRVIRTTSGDTRSRPRRFTLPKKPLTTLDTIGDGIDFSIPGVE